MGPTQTLNDKVMTVFDEDIDTIVTPTTPTATYTGPITRELVHAN